MHFLTIATEALPEDEREAARLIMRNLYSLQSLAQEFRSAIDLHLFCMNRRKLFHPKRNPQECAGLVNWSRLAGRAGAVAAYSFARIMEAINNTKAPTIWSKANVGGRKQATRLYAAAFPEVEALRKSAAHPNELGKNSAQQKRHSIKRDSPEGTTYVQIDDHCQIVPEGLIFGATVDGRFVRYELSRARAETLDACVSLYYSTFYPLEHPGAHQAREFSRECAERQALGQNSPSPWWDSLSRR